MDGGPDVASLLLQSCPQVHLRCRLLRESVEPTSPAQGDHNTLTDWQPQALEALCKASEEEAQHNCSISLLQLSQASPALVQSLFAYPRSAQKELTAALPAAQQQWLAKYGQDYSSTELSVKADAVLRVLPLPSACSISPDLLHPQLSRLRTRHAQRLIAVTGTVVRAGVVNVLESHRLYECRKCQHRCRPA